MDLTRRKDLILRAAEGRAGHDLQDLGLKVSAHCRAVSLFCNLLVVAGAVTWYSLAGVGGLLVGAGSDCEGREGHARSGEGKESARSSQFRWSSTGHHRQFSCIIAWSYRPDLELVTRNVARDQFVRLILPDFRGLEPFGFERFANVHAASFGSCRSYLDAVVCFSQQCSLGRGIQRVCC